MLKPFLACGQYKTSRGVDLACGPKFPHHWCRILYFTKGSCMFKFASFVSETNSLKQVGKKLLAPFCTEGEGLRRSKQGTKDHS